MSGAAVQVDRPLAVGEVLAAAVRIFTARPWPSLAMGVVEALALLLASIVPAVAALVILTLSFGLVFAVLSTPYLLYHHFRGHHGSHWPLLLQRLRHAGRALVDLAPHRIVADVRKP